MKQIKSIILTILIALLTLPASATYSLGIKNISVTYAAVNEDFTIKGSLYNIGDSPVSKIGYSYSIGGKNFEDTIDLDIPIEPHFENYTIVEFPIAALDDIGEYSLSLEIKTVNGGDNVSDTAIATAVVNVIPFVPVHRPMLEEFTGTWCGWCPRGYYALKALSELYGDGIVLAAYHEGDPMDVTETYPIEVTGFPSATFNRDGVEDPYYGNGDVGFCMKDEVVTSMETMVPAAIEVSATWANADKTAIAVKAKSTFFENKEDAGYKIGYLLINNGLSGSGASWTQSNYYPDYAAQYVGTELEMLTTWPNKVSGLVFNDVVVDASGMNGVEGSVPSDVAYNTSYETEFLFDIASNHVIQDKDKLYVAAFIINPNGTILNANKVNVDVSMGIGGLEEGDDFEYEGIWYTVLDAETQTCSTKGQEYDSALGDYVYPNQQCRGDIVIPAVVSDGETEYRVIEIGNRSFKGGELTSVSIPTGVEIISIGAFDGCQSLESVILPESITTIRATAFQSCINLSSINWPSALKTIEAAAFNYCKLTSAKLSEGVEELGKWVFQGNPIESVSLPAGLRSVEEAPFNSCKRLREVNYAAETPIEFEETMFPEDVYGCAILNMQNATLTSVLNTKPWNLFVHIVAKDGSEGFEDPGKVGEPFEYEGVWYKVIDEAKRTCSVSMPYIHGEAQIARDNNTIIPENVYYKDIEFTVTEVGEYAFYSVENLVSMTLPETIVKIGKNALTTCPRLASLVWKAHERLDSEVVEAIGNPNLLVYVDSVRFAPEGLYHNVVADGVCERLVLTPGYAFSPVESFTAKTSSITREFMQQTAYDGCAGWETIVLPFDVTRVVSKEGNLLTPFNRVNNANRQRPFWLYEAHTEGEWMAADSIKAGMPYIISMPNNPRYNPAYNISGPVTFSNPTPQRITAETTSPYAITWNSGREFRSLWLPLAADETSNVLGLNANMDDVRDETGRLLEPGSAFCRGITPEPLEAYVYHHDTIFEIKGLQSAVLTLTDDDGLTIAQENGTLLIKSSEDRTVEIYSADGTLLSRVGLRGGVSVSVDGLPQGVCLVAGRKVMIR